MKPRATIEIPTTVPDIGVTVDERSTALDVESGAGRTVRLEGDGSTIVYTSERNAAFELLNGEEIAVDTTTIGSKEEIALNLLGPLSRLVLLQRGEFVLHASVVRIGDRTAIFIAPSGGGKSTVAAGLYDRGYDVLSDDAGIVRLEPDPDVVAGPPVLKLHGESAERVDRGIEPVFSDGLEPEKRFYRLTDDEAPDRTSLDVVYLLEGGDEIELESVSARDAAVEFVSNSWGLPDRDPESIAENLRRCSKLAESVGVRRVRYPRSFEVFDDVLDRIEGDCDRGR